MNIMHNKTVKLITQLQRTMQHQRTKFPSIS